MHEEGNVSLHQDWCGKGMEQNRSSHICKGISSCLPRQSTSHANSLRDVEVNQLSTMTYQGTAYILRSSAIRLGYRVTFMVEVGSSCKIGRYLPLTPACCRRESLRAEILEDTEMKKGRLE